MYDIARISPELTRQQRRALERKMNKMARTKADVQQDYGQTCAQIGERSFQITLLEQEINNLKAKIVELGKEMQVVDVAEKKAAEQANPATAQPLTDVPVGGSNEVSAS
jgi:hypothetical protein